MGVIQDDTHNRVFVYVWFPMLLELCDIIAFDLQINRESVHLLGGDGRCDGRAH